MSRPIAAAVIVACALVLSCQSIRLNARQTVDHDGGTIVASQYAPEDEESCQVIEEKRCRYLQNVFKPLEVSCVDNLVKDGLLSEGTNYVYIEQAARVGGVQAGAHKATLYRCASPL